MRLLLLPALLTLTAARLLHSLPDDTHAFPKFRVAFLNRLPLHPDTAQRWLQQGLRGGELEFLDQPWTDRLDSHDPVTQPYTLEKMDLAPNSSYLCLVSQTDIPTPQPSDDESSDTPSRRGHRAPQEDPEWESYTLGRAPQPGADLTLAEQNAQANLELAQSSGSLYLVQRWSDGTLCDKTRKPREVEVQFHCSMTMTDTILFVKEAKTCSYVLVINTPRLCGEPGFKSYRDTSDENPIRCREIVDPLESGNPADIPDDVPDMLDYPIKLSRRKQYLPPAPAKVASEAAADSSETAYNELLLKAIESLTGKDSTVALREITTDGDAVVFELVEEFDMTDDQILAMENLEETLRAAGFDVMGPAAKGKKDDKSTEKDKAQTAPKTKKNNNKKQMKGRTWREEL
ncbi:hypothetical protein H0H92_013439 [Tricholoma furcatifolium]|nr:hypothetical protein H0H92_013439 [Tricholoma furcatifolium]